MHRSAFRSRAIGHRACSPLKALLLVLTLSILAGPDSAHGLDISVPVQLDYPLLRQLLIRQLFDAPGQTAEILNDPTGCSRITLADPRLGPNPAGLEITTEVNATLGAGVSGVCTTLLQWQGSAVLIGRPVIQTGERSLRIEPVDSWLVAADGGRLASGQIWNLASGGLQPLFGRFALDLSPSLETVGSMLPMVLPHRSAQQLQKIADSLRLGSIQASATGILVSLSFEVEELPVQPRPTTVLSPTELQQWETRWQMMDVLFTLAVKYFTSTTRDEELHNTLLEILLDSRYRLRDALAEPADRSNDPVRRWFLDSWSRLRPVVRRIGLDRSGQESLMWVSLLTATDALDVLDQLGPSVGLEISVDGLRRLARLINGKDEVDLLRYDLSVDPALQLLFQLPSNAAPLKPSAHPHPFNPWPIRSAWAGTANSGRLDRWVPTKNQLGEYLSLIADLLRTTADTLSAEEQFEAQIAGLFRNLVLATGWQESCWRQYVVNRQKIEPLRSSTGDVGLMQINEQIWRGFYDLQRLRWDIAYNSRAGGEILLNYLVRYVLKQGEHRRTGGTDNLARSTYSAYNGGPGQVARYRNSNAASAHKRIDAAFWEKYQQIKSGNEQSVASCLDSESTSAAIPPSPKTSRKNTGSGSGSVAGKTDAPRDAGVRWVMAQNPNHFTLQLAVFSRLDSARKYIAQQSLSGNVHIYSTKKAGSARFVVLYGSYPERRSADPEKLGLKHLNPWIRRFSELRSTEKS